MHSRTGGSLSTLMLSLPLAAVACMAIFGVPQFAPLIASGNDEELTRSSERRQRRGDQRTEDEFFSEFTSVDDNEAPPYADHSAEPRQAQDDWWHDSSRPQPARADNPMQPIPSRPAWAMGSATLDSPSAPQRRPATDTYPVSYGDATTVPPLAQTAVHHFDWQAAARRLNEIGVEKYHLERGQHAGSFLFVCLFQPAGSPQVVRRFEAEAADPLQAVNAVLGQIDDWLRTQYAASHATGVRAGSL